MNNYRGRLICIFNDSNKELIIETVRNVCGIKYFSFVEECSKEVIEMTKFVCELLIYMKQRRFQ